MFIQPSTSNNPDQFNMNRHRHTTAPPHSFFDSTARPICAPSTPMPKPRGIKQAMDRNCKLDELRSTIRTKQHHYRQFVESLSIAQRKPESLYHKRKRACEEHAMHAMCVCEVPMATPNSTINATLVGRTTTPHHGCSKRWKSKKFAVMWELVKDLEASTDVDYNFIMQDVAALRGKKRRITQTKHFRF